MDEDRKISVFFRLRDYLFDPPDFTVGQPNLDAVGVVGGPREDLLYTSPGEPTGPLILLEDDYNLGTYPDVASCPSVGFHGPAM